MPYPAATDLIGLGMEHTLANAIGGTDPLPDISSLCYCGLPAPQAAILGAVAYVSRPAVADLCALGMPYTIALQLGQ